jgi:hypothetical protein
MAKDLPKTHLSNFLEERLQRRLLQERQERAAGLGKRLEQVGLLGVCWGLFGGVLKEFTSP